MLTSRLQNVMHKLVHKDQQCAVKGRKIQNPLHNIRKIITYCKVKETPAGKLSLDQEKAFDTVSHSFLHKVLEASNLITGSSRRSAISSNGRPTLGWECVQCLPRDSMEQRAVEIEIE
ncbi:hypothetical protein RRG08_041068 [Elysia crispata]|uniref:Reverse transcriptase domain-containing protein n=1 Tax=Elysia crispata TaxID=231223 RepID=A0AAE0Y7N6_9GAST|nr:hypothetical protein RRG08_041068 [Elysia crispata]